jgi:site-specific DNA recombinase
MLSYSLPFDYYLVVKSSYFDRGKMYFSTTVEWHLLGSQRLLRPKIPRRAPWHNAPFGYVNIRDNEGRPTLQINELKAPVVRFIFQQFINSVAPSLISKEARKIGYTISGNSAIMRVLTNPIYAGLLRLPAYNGEPEKIVKALHEPIMSEVDFWIANDKINNRPRYRTRPREDFPLRGIVKCDCGWHLTASYNKGKNQYYMYYSCPKERNRNYRGERMRELIEKVLAGLSFTPQQIDKISRYAKENLEQETKERKLLHESQAQKLKEVVTKIERLEERLIKDE